MRDEGELVCSRTLTEKMVLKRIFTASQGTKVSLQAQRFSTKRDEQPCQADGGKDDDSTSMKFPRGGTDGAAAEDEDGPVHQVHRA